MAGLSGHASVPGRRRTAWIRALLKPDVTDNGRAPPRLITIERAAPFNRSPPNGLPSTLITRSHELR
ncbi:hypothetical protein PCAR4_460045 [Paraburkholderia caribensis]|nr:hypothetical protein PCAR4_460045 [Paraburkholderia caribensis]